MKIKLWCDSGANAHSCNEQVVDLSDLGISEKEWKRMTEEQKGEAVKDVALSQLDWGFAEIES